MPGWIIHAIERSTFDVNSPPAADINRIFRQTTAGWGGWIGPSVRVTRQFRSTATDDSETHAANLYALPDDQNTRDHGAHIMQTFATTLGNALQTLSEGQTFSYNWAPVEVIPYNPRVHGSVEWWRSGRAAQTRTRDSFPTGTARLEATENPIGPTDESQVAGAGIAGWLGQISGALGSAALPLLGVVAAFMLLPTLTQAMNARAARRRRARNPQPLAWQLGPDTPYECRAPSIGKRIPGRRGGIVKSCATPRPEDYIAGKARKGAKGQWYVAEEGSLPGFGWTMKKSVASRRLRPQKPRDTEYKRDASTSDVDLAAFQHDRKSRDWIPSPPELEFPHAKGSSKCDYYHPLWEAQRQAVAEMPPFYDLADVKRDLRQHPLWPEWQSAEDACVDAWAGRVERRRAKGSEFAPRAVRARLTREAKARGEDVGAAAFLDDLKHALDAQKRRR